MKKQTFTHLPQKSSKCDQKHILEVPFLGSNNGQKVIAVECSNRTAFGDYDRKDFAALLLHIGFAVSGEVTSLFYRKTCHESVFTTILQTSLSIVL